MSTCSRIYAHLFTVFRYLSKASSKPNKPTLVIIKQRVKYQCKHIIECKKHLSK